MTGTRTEWAVLAATNFPVFVLLVWLGSHRMEDFSAFYTAGFLWRHFPGTGLYDLNLQMETQRNLLGYSGLPFYHLPYELAIYAPLSLLPYRAALWLWRVVCLGLLLFTCATLTRITDRKVNSRDGFLMSLSFFPVLLCLAQGQDSILLLAIICASAYFYASGRDATAGAILALGLFKFQFVLPIVAILVLRRKGRFAVGFAAVGSAMAAISLAMVRPEGVSRLAGLIHNAQASTALGVSPTIMPNLRGLLSTIVKTPATANLLTLGASVVLVLAVGFARRPVQRPLEFAAATCVATLVSYHMNPHDMVILLLPIALVIAQLRKGEQMVEHLTILAYLSTVAYLLFLNISNFAGYVLPAAALLWILMRKAAVAPSVVCAFLYPDLSRINRG